MYVCVFVRQSSVICSQQRVVLTKLYPSQTSNADILPRQLANKRVSGKTKDKMDARYAERLPRYPPETTRMRKKLVPRLFLYWGTWAVAPCGWVTTCLCFGLRTSLIFRAVDP